MRLRDIIIVAVSIAASMFAWYQEGVISIRPSFFVGFTDSDAAFYSGSKPIISDINGDGMPEVIFNPSRDVVNIIPTWRIRRSYHDNYITLDRTRTIQLSANCIGMAVGYLEFPANETRIMKSKGKAAAKDTREQVLAVVTDDYRVTVYRDGGSKMNGEMEELWSKPILPPLEATLVVYHASVRVMPFRLYAEDTGMVVVAVKAPGPNGTEVMLHVALHGQTGEVRWRHRTEPFNAAKLASQDFKDISRLRFTEKDLDEHAQETDWTKFRESVVAALPHQWSHPWDGKLDVHAFFTEKTRKKHKAAHDEKVKRAAKYKSKKFDSPTADDFGQLGERFGSAQSKKSDTIKDLEFTPNVLVSHTETGMELIHLYTGRVITSITPLRKRSIFHDLDDDYHIDEVRTRVGVQQKAFGRHGMDEEVLCLGVITSGRPTENHPLYNATVCDTEGYFHFFNVLSHYLHGDEASYVPTRDPLSLIGSRPIGRRDSVAAPPLVVQHQIFKGNGIYKVTRDAVFLLDSGLVTAINPVGKRVVWRADTLAGFGHSVAESAGEAGVIMHSQEEKEARTPTHYPHLAAYHFRHRRHEVLSEQTSHEGNDPIVLAVGDEHLVAINAKSGIKQAVVQLPHPPTAPVIVGDFNGDGLNDIIIVTKYGLYGLLVSHKVSGSIVTMLMLLMVLMLVMLYASQSMVQQHDREIGGELDAAEFPPPPSRPVRVKRSTD
jgi:hypothetical protein